MLVRREPFGKPRRHCGVVDLAESLLQLFEAAQESLRLRAIDGLQKLEAIAKLFKDLRKGCSSVASASCLTARPRSCAWRRGHRAAFRQCP